MGKRKKPVQQLAPNGQRQRERKKKEPEPAQLIECGQEIPDPPKWLDDPGDITLKELYTEFAERARDAGGLSSDNDAAIAIMAQNVYDYLQARRELGGQFVAYSKEGVPFPDPLRSTHTGLQRSAFNMIKEFGLTPSSRGNIDVTKTPEGKKRTVGLFADEQMKG